MNIWLGVIQTVRPRGHHQNCTKWVYLFYVTTDSEDEGPVFTQNLGAPHERDLNFVHKNIRGKERNSLVSVTLLSMNNREVYSTPTYIWGTQINTKTERNTDKLGTESVLVPVQYEHHTILYVTAASRLARNLQVPGNWYRYKNSGGQFWHVSCEGDMAASRCQQNNTSK